MSISICIILIVVVSLVMGFALGYFIQKSRLASVDTIANAKIAEVERLSAEIEKLRGELLQKSTDLSVAQTNLVNLKDKLDGQSVELEKLQKQLTIEFENIANRVLKARSDEFAENNKKNLDAILNPLGEKINDFKIQVRDAFEIEKREQISLKEQIKMLTEQNSRISDEANNLTKALKGEVKTQGNWGEMILERVLEISGLQEGREYEREEVSKNMEGKTYRPDVIIHLPDNKHIIVDSKVSLTAYERFSSAQDVVEREAACKAHLASLKKHVQELADKDYPNLLGVNAPDFVLMFVPIESMLSVVVDPEQTLFSYAWEHRVVIVTPTTLLATLRTIASIWQQENQTKNALEIARLSGALYDKLAGFVEEMRKIKTNIDSASKSYDEALKKLSQGQGNALTTAEKIKKLGAKTSKNLPNELIEQ